MSTETDDRINTILARYELTRLRTDLEELMRLTNTPVLLWQGYTPSFNDGDPCVHRTVFFGIPGATGGDYNEYYGVLTKDGWMRVDYADDVKELHGGNPPGQPSWVITMQYYVMTFLIETNTEGIISLEEDGSLKITSKPYYRD